MSIQTKELNMSCNGDLFWVSTCRAQLRALTSELMNGIHSLHLLFVIQNFERSMRLNMVKYKGTLSNINFKEWNTAIRNVLYHFRMLVNISDIKVNKKRISSSLGRLSATYINFVLQSLEDREITTPETCRCEGVGLYEFLKVMSTQGDGSSKALQLVDSILSSEELLRSYKHKRIAYYFMRTMLADRNFYSNKAETYLKFLALVSVFRRNFTQNNKAIKDCLDDCKYGSPPASSLTGSKSLSFLKGIQETEYEELELQTSETIFKRIIPNKLIRSSKLACKYTEISKTKRKKIKKYLAKIQQKGKRSKNIGRRDGNGSSSQSQLSFRKKPCNGRLSETIDEILTKGQEHADDSFSTDLNEENESNSGRSGASDRTEELNTAVSLEDQGQSDRNTGEGSCPHGEPDSGSELEDILLTDDEKTDDKVALPLPLTKPTATMNCSTPITEVESGGNEYEMGGNIVMSDEIKSGSESECVELEKNSGNETVELVDLEEDAVHDREYVKLDEEDKTGYILNIQIEEDEGEEIQRENEELQEGPEFGEFQEHDDLEEVENVNNFLEDIEELQEEHYDSSSSVSSSVEGASKSGATDFEVVDLESSGDELSQESKSRVNTKEKKSETSSRGKEDELVPVTAISPGRVQLQQEETEDIMEEESESSCPVEESDVPLSPKLPSKEKGPTPTSSTSDAYDGKSPSKATVLPGEDDDRTVRHKILLSPIKDTPEAPPDGERIASPVKSVYFTRTRTRTHTDKLEIPSSSALPLRRVQQTQGEGLRSPEREAKLRSNPRQKRASGTDPVVLDTPAKRTRSAIKKLEQEIEVVTLEDESLEKSSTMVSPSRLRLRPSQKVELVIKSSR